MIPVPIFYTGNRHKAREFRAIMGDDCVVEHCTVEEIQADKFDIIAGKAIMMRNAFGQIPFLIEDVSLEIDCLNGMPGPYVKWFTTDGDGVMIAKMISGFKNKAATAHCIYALSDESGLELFHGVCHGTIVDPRAASDNENVFGFDAVFQPDGSNLTFAEMVPSEKHKISHRGNALAKVKAHLAKISGKH